MQVIVYKPSNSERSASWARQVCRWAHPFKASLCVTPVELTGMLDALGDGRYENLLVLLAEERQHLRGIEAMRNVLAERHCIVVLPDFGEESLAIGHRLYPRFVTTFDAPPEQMGAVVMRIVQRLLADAPKWGTAAG